MHLPLCVKRLRLEEKQCQEQQILNSGHFEPNRHAITIRSDDSHDINLVTDNFSFDPTWIIDVIKYASIENKNCPY